MYYVVLFPNTVVYTVVYHVTRGYKLRVSLNLTLIHRVCTCVVVTFRGRIVG